MKDARCRLEPRELNPALIVTPTPMRVVRVRRMRGVGSLGLRFPDFAPPYLAAGVAAPGIVLLQAG